VLTFFFLWTAGCSTGPDIVIDAGERYALAASGIEEYKLAPGDKVGVSVFKETSLSGEFIVAADGTLSLPLIGEVAVVDKLPNEVAEDVQRRLSDGYLLNPRVNVQVVQYRPYFVLGEVSSPGQYPYSAGLTVLNAVAAAKGYTPRAARKYVYIRPAGTAAEVAYRLTPNLRVRPGDTIRIDERFF
jgi:polysaccharide export outer membrane protein